MNWFAQNEINRETVRKYASFVDGELRVAARPASWLRRLIFCWLFGCSPDAVVYCPFFGVEGAPTGARRIQWWCPRCHRVNH